MKLKNKLLFSLLLVSSTGLLKKANAGDLSLASYAFPSKEGRKADTVWIVNKRSGERDRTLVDSIDYHWGGGLLYYNPGDSVAVYVKSNGDTVAQTFYKGPAIVCWLPNLYVNGHGLNVRNAFTENGDSIYGKCWIPTFLDTIYGKFQSNYPGGPTARFRVSFDGTKLSGFEFGRQFNIEVRLRDSSATSTGLIEGKFIDADTGQSPIYLTYNPGFRDVLVERIQAIPDTVNIGDSVPLNVVIRNRSDLRKETPQVIMTRKRNGQTLDSICLSRTLEPPHFTPDSAFVEFPSWIVRNQDSGLNVITYYIPLADSNPENNQITDSVFVIGDTTGISDDHPLLINNYRRNLEQSIISHERLIEIIRNRELDNVDVYDATGREIGTGDLKRGVYFFVPKTTVTEAGEENKVEKVLVIILQQ
ncbi:MAG: hypothetical protein ABIK48_08580 [candidate division WOR-3 bacterium]